MSIEFCAIALVLVLMAAVFSDNLSDDSYAHFATSVTTCRALDWRSWVSGVWNPPLPALLYGTSGQAGLFAARVTAVAVTLLILVSLLRVVRVVSPSALWATPATVIALLVFQPAVFNQSFQSMTELVAAMCLSLALAAIATNRDAAGWFFLGLAPLARLETIPLVLASFVLLAFLQWRRSNDSPPLQRLRRLTGFALAGGCIPLCWWMIGWLVKGSPFWMKVGYTRLRPSVWQDGVAVNALSGLAGVLSAPQLLLCAAGVICIPPLLRRDAPPERRTIALLLITILGLHFCLLSMLIVYPRGTGFGDLAIAAVNARNYNVTAPLLALLAVFGLAGLIPDASGGSRTRVAWVAAPLCAAVGVIWHFLFQQRLMPDLRTLCLLNMAKNLGVLLIGAIGMRVLARAARLRDSRGSPAWPFSRVLLGLCAVAWLLTDPAGWYPPRRLDQAAVAQRELRQWYQEEYRIRAPAIIQDLNGRLDFYCGIRDLPVLWLYPEQFQSYLDAAAPGTLVVIETDHAHQLRRRYPESLRREVEDAARYTRIAESRRPAPVTWIDRLLAGITSRNAPKGWLVYRKESTAGAPR